MDARTSNSNGGRPITTTTNSWWRVADVILGADGSVQVVPADTSRVLNNPVLHPQKTLGSK